MACPVPDLSVVVICYNAADLINSCLQSVLYASGSLQVEVVVVDNASQDGTASIVLTDFPDVHLISCERNDGFAAGVNRGAEAAHGRILLLLNPDAILEKESLTAFVAFMDRNPVVGVAGARTFDSNHHVSLTAYGPFTPLTVIWQYAGLDRLFPYQVFGRFRHACETATVPVDVSWVQGSAMAIRREPFQQIGGFDEGFFLYCEETDFCTRAIEAGWRVAYLPQARVTHTESSTASRYPATKVLHHHLSPLHYFRKREREDAVLFLKIGFTFELMLKSAIRLFQRIIRRDDDRRGHLGIYANVLCASWRY